MVEARESQRDLMRQAALEMAPSAGSSADVSPSDSAEPRAYLDLAVRKKLQAARSTVTSLESLASSIDLEDPNEKYLKRSKDLISAIEKESQVKEQRHTFRGLFPAGDNDDPKGVAKKPRPGKTV